MTMHMLVVSPANRGESESYVAIYSSLGNAKAGWVEFAKTAMYDHNILTYEAACERMKEISRPVITEVEVDGMRFHSVA